MLEQVRAALAELCERFKDTRVHYCEVEAEATGEEEFRLAGAVLDAPTYLSLTELLIDRFPDACFDAADVQVLRSPTPRLLYVATNLAGLYAGPSTLAEQVSQIVNGWRVEVLREQEEWAFVRLDDGYLGWAYRPYLSETPSPAPTHLIAEPVALVYAEPDIEAPLRNRLVSGTAVCAEETQGAWSRLAPVGAQGGWVQAAALRALDALPADGEARRRQIVEDAQRLVGVPYLWGGCSALGIDCSGFARLLHALSGVALPRDADMQYEAGRGVEEPFRPGDLLFFSFGRRAITHVGVSLGGWQMIHSSGSHNGVFVDDVQLVARLREGFVGARSFLG